LAAVRQWVCDYPGGARVSERFKSAFRVALAMMLTYGVSLAMDWDKAFWAALSVIFCSLATAGQSINAGVDRVLGTAASGVLALLLVAFFPQGRWPFLLALSAIIAVCSYHLTADTPRKAIWFNAAFNLPIIALLGEMGGPIAPASFEMAVLRVQQTALGALVYSLVAVLVWPRRGDEDFVGTMCGIAEAQQRLFTGCASILLGKRTEDDLRKILAQVAAQLPLLRGQMEGAAYDSPRVHLVAGAWVRHIDNTKLLHRAFERWRTGFDELEGIDLHRYLPHLAAFVAETEACLAGVRTVLSGQPVSRRQPSMELSLNEKALRELTHVQRAAVVSCHGRLTAIARLAEAQFETAREIAGAEPAAAGRSASRAKQSTWVIDLDRLAGVVRQMAVLWTAFLLIIYLEGVPIPVATVALANAFGMVFMQMPHVSPMVMWKSVLQGGIFGGAVYMLLMPHLSGYLELGSLLFLLTFGIAYVFHEPRTMLSRGMWMVMLVLIIQVDNQQTYSFLAFASWFLVGVLFVTILVFASRFPMSFAGEHQFRWQFRRFWRSAACLLADLSAGRAADRLDRWRHRFNARQLAALPARLKVWSGALPSAVLESEGRQRLTGMVSSMELLSYRMQDLEDAYPQVLQVRQAAALRAEGADTRETLCALMETLGRDPIALDAHRCREILEKAESRLEQRVDEVLRGGDLPREEEQRIYRLLGAYRGLLEAFGDVVDALTDIDWMRLREARF